MPDNGKTYRPLNSRTVSEDIEQYEQYEHIRPKKAVTRWNNLSNFLIFFLSVTCVALLIYVKALRESIIDETSPHRAAYGFTASQSLADEAIEYQWVPPPGQFSWFTGPPTTKLEHKWNDLVASTVLRVSKDELVEAGELDSVALKDGGYAAGLAVSHQMHCVKRLKNFIYSDQPKFSESSGNKMTAEYLEAQFHADHCIEVLRQHVMCHIDTQLVHLEYKNNITRRPGVVQTAPRLCKNYDKLHSWMAKRAVNTDMFVEPDWE